MSWYVSLSIALLGPAGPADVSEAQRPYRVLVRFLHDPSPVLPSASMRDLIHDFSSAASRLLGKSWELRVEEDVAANVHVADPPEIRDHDKVIDLRIDLRPGRMPAVIRAREYDGLLKAWGPLKSARVRSDRDVPLQALRLCVDVFRPTAVILDRQRGQARIGVRGMALVPATSDVQLLANGEPLAIVRTIEGSDDPSTVVPWSFLVYRLGPHRSRFQSDADVVSVFRDPLTRRSRQKIQLAAVACRAGDDAATVIEFRNREDNLPIIGYEVAARTLDQKGTVPLGSTDYSGSIRVSMQQVAGRGSRWARVCEMYLLSGDVVLTRFPVVPGQHSRLLAETPVDPLLPEFSGRVLSFQESLVDESARRKVLELRLSKAAEKSDLERMNELAAALNALPDRRSVLDRLDAMEQEMQSQADTLGRKIGSNLRRLFLQTHSLVERAVPQERVVIKITEETVPADP